MIYPTLFKRTSTGAIQVWYRILDEDNARYRSVSGQFGGAKIESGWQAPEGKNIGKSNATTPLEQCKLEIDAAYVKKLAQGGYHESVDDIDTPKFFKPMLAKSYDENPIKVWSNVWTQPKLDGMRGIVTADGMWSRQGKPIDTCPHVLEDLQPVFAAYPDLILDGEIYADKLNDNFNEIMHLARKKKPDAAHLAKTKASLQFHVYDLPSCDGGFEHRTGLLTDIIYEFEPASVALVATHAVLNQDDLDAFYAQYVADGYEGQIVRLGGTLYENKRSKQLLKRKEFNDAEFEVVEIVEGGGNRSGMAGYVTYKLPDGREFGSGIKGTHEYCKKLLSDAKNYEGGQGTVQYFGLTPDGIPRFPVTLALFEGTRDV